MRQDRVDPLAAEVRAVEAGLKARYENDGTFTVASTTRSRRWKVRVELVRQSGVDALRAVCECEGGQARPAELTACLHGACCLRSLERRGLAKWNGGYWIPSRSLDVAS